MQLKVINITELESAILSCEIENVTRPHYGDFDETVLTECKNLEVNNCADSQK
jgi:hypothetical protein